MGRAPAPGSRPVAPLLALLAGLAYALAEILRHQAVPSPPGVPGDSGGSFLAVTALAVLVCAGPAVLVSLFVRRSSLAGEWLALTAGASLVASAGFWRALDRSGWLLEHPGWTPAVFLAVGPVLGAIAAAAVLPLVSRWPGRWHLPAWVPGLIVVGAGVVFVSGLRVPPAPTGTPGDQPNLLLVTIDTLRRDGLGSYGATSPTSLDSLGATAHEGWSVASWTQPSMASLFSGAVPTGHGSDTRHAPDPAVAWWTEVVAAQGSRTAAIVTNPYLRRRFGFARGFGHFDHAEERPHLEPVARTVLAEWLQAWLNQRPDSDRADRIVGRALRWLDSTSPEQPWFLWVHLLDPHLPYTLRGPGGEERPASDPGWLEPLGPVMGESGFESLHEIRHGSLILDADQRSALRQLYQTEVDYSAWWAAGLVRRALEVSGTRELLWVVTSDHGEEFFDEGGFEHGHSLGDAVLRVPLLASGLGEAPKAFRLHDLGPAILDRLGSSAAFDPSRGTQLLETDGLLGSYALARPPEFAACDRPPMLAEGMLYGPERTRVYLPDGRAFERDDETGETRPLARCEDAVGIAVEFDWRALELWRERRTLSPVGIEVDDDLRRQLRALGYVN
jgi:arylsulfatase A-like enzyme